MPVELVAIPLEADVESEETLLLVVDRPVDSEPTLLWAVLMPVEADVESDETLLLVVDRPVDSEPTPL
jgi:hypothetical protein